MRNKLTTYGWLQQAIAALDDDLSQPWSDYPCLEWPFSQHGPGYKTGKGYGTTTRNGKRVKVSRAAYELTCGSVADGTHMLHHCDNPPCFRPIHLFPGTNLDNIRDRMKKGRSYIHGPIPNLRGEAHGLAKLTWAQVREIRSLRESLVPRTEVAECFNVTPATITRITKRTHWTDDPQDQ